MEWPAKEGRAFSDGVTGALGVGAAGCEAGGVMSSTMGLMGGVVATVPDATPDVTGVTSGRGAEGAGGCAGDGATDACAATAEPEVAGA